MTLNALTWASNTNYSTGPDTGTPTKVNPSGSTNGFVNGTVAAAQHVNYVFNLIAAELLKAVDGTNGGTYTLTAPLRFEGSDVQIAADLEVVSGGEINVNAGGQINVDSGAQIDIAGDLNLLSGGDFDIASGGDVTWASGADAIFQSGSGFTIQDGAVFNVTVASGAITFKTGTGWTIESGGSCSLQPGSTMSIDDIDDILVSVNKNARLELTPVWVEDDTGVPCWNRSTSAPGAGWIQTDVGAARLIMFPLVLAPGDDILALTMILEGGFGAGHGAFTLTPPILRLIKVDAAGTSTTIGSQSDTSVDATAYDAAHSVVLALGAPETVSGSNAYYVVVIGETGGSAAADTTIIRSINASVTVKSFRGKTSLIVP